MEHLINQLGTIDIYLIDQIMKSRYKTTDIILDAGCGNGRNINLFYNNGFSIYGFDINEKRIKNLKQKCTDIADNFSVSSLDNASFKNEMFDHIICIAVLHFAKDTNHFKTMFSELVRILKPKGSLLIRVASNIGLEKDVTKISEGVYLIPDKTKRYLLTKSLLQTIMQEFKLSFLEPIKTVNVNDKRFMTTLVLQKN